MPKPEPNSSILQQDQLELNETFNFDFMKEKSILIFVFFCKKVETKKLCHIY